MLWLLILLLLAILLLIVIFNTGIKQTISCAEKHLDNNYREIIFDNNSGGGLIPKIANFNPSIISLKNGNYAIALRQSNIHIDNVSHIIHNLSSSNDKKSTLSLILLDNNFNKLTTFPNTDNNIIYEDGRLFAFNNMFYISAVDYIPGQRIFPALLEYDENFNYKRRIDYLVQPSLGEVDKFSLVQKNWCPFSHNSRLFIHTDSYPVWRIREIILDVGNYAYVKTVLEHNIAHMFSPTQYPLLRCSTSWIDFTDDTYLACLHTKTKIYTIRTLFVEISKYSLLPINKSKLLCLNHNHARLQFTSGLTRRGSDIIISYGLYDTKYGIKVLSYDYIRSLLTDRLL